MLLNERAAGRRVRRFRSRSRRSGMKCGRVPSSPTFNWVNRSASGRPSSRVRSTTWAAVTKPMSLASEAMVSKKRRRFSSYSTFSANTTSPLRKGVSRIAGPFTPLTWCPDALYGWYDILTSSREGTGVQILFLRCCALCIHLSSSPYYLAPGHGYAMISPRSVTEHPRGCPTIMAKSCD